MGGCPSRAVRPARSGRAMTSTRRPGQAEADAGRFEGVTEHPLGLYTCEWCGEILSALRMSPLAAVEQPVLAHMGLIQHNDAVNAVEVSHGSCLPRIKKRRSATFRHIQEQCGNGRGTIMQDDAVFPNFTNQARSGVKELLGLELSPAHVATLTKQWPLWGWLDGKVPRETIADLCEATKAKTAAVRVAAAPELQHISSTLPLVDIVGVILSSVFDSPFAAIHTVHIDSPSRWVVKHVPSIFLIEAITATHGAVQVSIRLPCEASTQTHPVAQRAVNRLREVVLALKALVGASELPRAPSVADVSSRSSPPVDDSGEADQRCSCGTPYVDRNLWTECCEERAA